MNENNNAKYWETRARTLAVENVNLKIALRELAKVVSLESSPETMPPKGVPNEQ